MIYDRKHLDNVLRMQRHENVNTPQNDETGDDDNVNTMQIQKYHINTDGITKH